MLNTNSKYRQNLIEKVIELSEASDWTSAVLEWELEDYEEDECLSSDCVCGKENLRYLFTIANQKNGNTLYPIGSSCIKKFNRSDLSETVALKEQLFKLLHATENREFITLSSDFFSRKLLNHLFEEGAFKATEYNRFNSEIDYNFLLDMFNKRDKDSITQRQKNKITAILMNSIIPFLHEILENKTNAKG